MTEEPMSKKIRIWNPAVTANDNQNDSDNSSNAENSEDAPLDCSKSIPNSGFPNIFQNYLQLAAPLMLRLQQQRQFEEFARRQMMSGLIQMPRAPAPPAPSVHSTPPQEPITLQNPIVASVLGSQLVNENCCAVCGVSFRLTGDLVQHMRNNHRKSKFKRKADLKVQQQE
ncbi:unnamed protein product [Caenorhabditis bovis]|uniref:C2H2-type domain-containing protein n=1 Tax=Caenorhabditis bovis TaxID=2654633 RepID=A0A8S1EWL7_9PELO|nr:unnamed protein product [Caenorhabditis bovis]